MQGRIFQGVKFNLQCGEFCKTMANIRHASQVRPHILILDRESTIDLPGKALIDILSVLQTVIKNETYIENISYDLILSTVFPMYTLGSDQAYQGRLLQNTIDSITERDNNNNFRNWTWYPTSLAGLTRLTPSLNLTEKEILDCCSRQINAKQANEKIAWVLYDILAAHILLFHQYSSGGLEEGQQKEEIMGSIATEQRKKSDIIASWLSWLKDELSNGRSIHHHKQQNHSGHSGIPEELKTVMNRSQREALVLLDDKDYLATIEKSSHEVAIGQLKRALPKLPGMAIHISTLGGGDSKGGKPILGTSTRGRVYLTIRIRTTKSRKYLKVLNKVFPPTSKTDANHQTLKLADWVWSYLHQEKLPGGNLGSNSPAKLARELNGLLRFIPLGTPQQIVLGMLVAGTGIVEKTMFREMYITSGVLVGMPKQIALTLKAMSILVRKSGLNIYGVKLTPLQTRSLAYYELLGGRSANVTNWEEEINNRTKNTTHIQCPNMNVRDGFVPWESDEKLLDSTKRRRDPLFYEKLMREVYKICEPLVTKRNTKETLEAFVGRRHEWMASGSSAGSKLVHANEKINGMKISKRAWAESISVKDVREVLEKVEPTEVAHASEKYENGKARAIYGVEPMHYVINTYATKGFEERLHLIPGLEKGSTGSKLAAQECKRALITSNIESECTMLDYADFNRHHTPEAQAIIFKAFASLGRRRGAHPDWIAANEWVAKAKRKMAAVFPGHDRPLRIVQGMFSGTRSTDLINTILNLAYYRIAVEYVKDMYNITPIDIYNVHQGDDVWISNKNKLWSRMLYYALNTMGFIFQENKQMFGQGRGEYLRVLYLEGCGGGYFGRALSNYITRPLQQSNPLDPIAWARTIRDGASLLMRRGLTAAAANVLYDNAISFWARARAHTKDRSPVSLPKSVFYFRELEGGLGLPPPGQVMNKRLNVTLPPMPRYKSTMDLNQFNLPAKMTNDWITKVSRDPRFNEHDKRGLNADLIRQTMVVTNYGEDLKDAVSDKGWAKYKKEWARYKTTIPIEANDFAKHSVPVGSLDHLFEVDAIACAPGNPRQFKRGPACRWEIQMTNIEAGVACKSRSSSDLMLATQQAIVSSTFKSEGIMAQALGISKLEAVSLILSKIADDETVTVDLIPIINAIRNSQNYDNLSLLLDGPGALIPGIDDWVNPSTWRLVQTQFVEQLLQYLITKPNWTKRQIIELSVGTWASWLTATKMHISALTRVVY